MHAKYSEERRPLVFLAVLMSHVVIVLLLARPGRQAASAPGNADQPLILMLLHELATAATHAGRPPQPTAPGSHERPRNPKPEEPIAPAAEAPAPPRIDWLQEAELAARSGVADAETEKSYRDLSALSPAQLAWNKRNHMVPAPPGIHWNHPRLEFTENGLPIFWINDRCVLVTVFVYCAIGHTEADGGLFKHMRDPQDR